MKNNNQLKTFISAVRDKKIIGFAATYLVIGIGMVEFIDIIVPRLNLPSKTIDFILAGLFFGFPISLTVRWRMTEVENLNRVSAIWPTTSLIALIVFCGWFGTRAIMASNNNNNSLKNELPLVILMDSSHPARVYDEETRLANATNADVLSDVLMDLPIQRQRETISPSWHRDEDILRFNPDLVLIHWSGFRQEDGRGPRTRLKLFVSYFVETQTKFIIYSRQDDPDLRKKVNDLFRDLDTKYPGLLDRIFVFGLTTYGPKSWLSPLVRNPMKLKVKEILEIP